MVVLIKVGKMAEPKDKPKVSVFFYPSDRRDFKKLCADAEIPMCGRLEAWAKLDIAYFNEYGKVLSIEDIQQMYFGEAQ